MTAIFQPAPEERLVGPRDHVGRPGSDELVAAWAAVLLLGAAHGPHGVALAAGAGLGARDRSEPVRVERDVRVTVRALATAPGAGHQGAGAGTGRPSSS